MIGLCSRGMARMPLLDSLLEMPTGYVVPGMGWRFSGFAGWGAKPSGRRAERLAAHHGVPCLRIEDGFLRSFGTGRDFPSLSIVVDDIGIYYDSTRPSALEAMLASDSDVLAGIETEVDEAIAAILFHGLSKYNHAPDASADQFGDGVARRVLVVDQTFGDLSVRLGGASAETFVEMFEAARNENPGAHIYVKTHPEVSSGQKTGYLANLEDIEGVTVIRDAVNPLSLIGRVDRVYVVTSQMGFEALLAGKQVSCFGLPFYAGWGVTDDRQLCVRRGRKRSVREIFAAAYVRYSRYLDPTTHRRGRLADVIRFLAHQRSMATKESRRTICVGFRRWRRYNLGPMLSLRGQGVLFADDAAEAAALVPTPQDRMVYWGREAPPGVECLADSARVPLWRMEDGFVRSVGLGSDLVRPWSVVLDSRGIYFDPERESDLEFALNAGDFTAVELERARRVRELIVVAGVTKYNVESRAVMARPDGVRLMVLVPGQVEDDASIRYGCGEVRTNADLLRAAREAHPDAWIVYKPHPDVVSHNRIGRLAMRQAAELADHVEVNLSIVSCLAACDVVHTMTSLTGFDALLRGKRVVVYGRPFYAGWGLTDDRYPILHRRRSLSLDELVAGALLRYPLYWDWVLRGYTSCEAVLARLVDERDRLEAGDGLRRLRDGFLRRQVRKGRVLLAAALSR